MLSLRNSFLAGAAIAALLPFSAQAAQQINANRPSVQSDASISGTSMIPVVPAGKLINRQLRDERGFDAGRIDAVVLDTQNGAVDFVLIAGSGPFDLNGQIIAVPWSALATPIPDNGPITIKISADKLVHAPRLNPNAVTAVLQPRMRNDVYGYWGYPYPPYGPYGRLAPYGYGYGRGAGVVAGAPVAPAAGPASGEGSSNQPQNAEQQSQTQQQLVSNGLVIGAGGVFSALQSSTTSSASGLKSADVYAANGDLIGHLDQVMIDPQHGETAFVLVERGGFLGLSPRWYALPIEALAWSPYEGGYRLTVPEQKLDNQASVAVDEIHLPNRVQAKELAQLYRQFEIRPYWEQGQTSSGSSSGDGNGSATAAGSSQQPSSQQPSSQQPSSQQPSSK